MTSVIRGGLVGLTVLAGTLALVRPSRAQDALKEAEERLKVEAQRVDRLVMSALSESKTLGTKSSAGLELLRVAKKELDSTTAPISQERRDYLQRQLKYAMMAYGFSETVVTPGPTTHPVTPRPDPQVADARKQWEQMRSRYEQGNDARGMSDAIRRKASDGWSKQDLAFMQSMVPPPPGEYTLPRNWKELSERRKDAGIKLTEEEKKIIKALNAKVGSFDAEGKTFKEVLEDLKKRTGVSIAVDPRALEDLNITYNTTFSAKLGDVTTRTVLKRLLSEIGLTYVMKDNAIQVTTPARAKEMLTTRAYSVMDLMPLAAPRQPQILNMLQMQQTMQILVMMITQTIEPESWEVNGKGGLGTIAFDPTKFVLVVKQTAEMHYMMSLSNFGR